jgi:hypothetical protein
VRLTAKVRGATGGTRHVLATIEAGVVKPGVPLPAPVSADIVEDEHGYFLIRLDPNGDEVGDTWHESLDEAKTQAAWELGIAEKDWGEAPFR